MKLKRHKNGNRWEVANYERLPAGWWPVVMQEGGAFVPKLFLPAEHGSAVIIGRAAGTVGTAWRRLEDMIEKKMYP
jgi:hypothetical protein